MNLLRPRICHCSFADFGNERKSSGFLHPVGIQLPFHLLSSAVSYSIRTYSPVYISRRDILKAFRFRTHNSIDLSSRFRGHGDRHAERRHACVYIPCHVSRNSIFRYGTEGHRNNSQPLRSLSICLSVPAPASVLIAGEVGCIYVCIYLIRKRMYSPPQLCTKGISRSCKHPSWSCNHVHRVKSNSSHLPHVAFFHPVQTRPQ
jgi:hypothetical protein